MVGLNEFKNLSKIIVLIESWYLVFFDSRNSNLNWIDNFIFKPLPGIIGKSFIVTKVKLFSELSTYLHKFLNNTAINSNN